MQIDLAPDADRVKRNFDLVQMLRSAAFAPEFVIGGMPLQQEIQIACLLARGFAICRVAIDDAILVPPIAAEKIAQYAALINRSAIGIVQSIEGGDAGKRGRPLNSHPPLQHAEIGLPYPADFAVRPGLAAEPFDDVVEIFLFIAIQKTELATRPALAARVHLCVDIAAFDIQFDRAGFSPEKLRSRRQRVVVVAVGRCCEHNRIGAVAFGSVERNCNFDTVMDPDFHFMRLLCFLRSSPSPDPARLQA